MAEERRPRQGGQTVHHRELAQQMLAGASLACEVARVSSWKAYGRDESDMKVAYAGFLQGLSEADTAEFPETAVLIDQPAAADSAKRWQGVLESLPSVARARALFLDSPQQYAEMFIQEFDRNAAACRKHDPMNAEVREARHIVKEKKTWNRLTHEELEAWTRFVAKPFDPLPLCDHLARSWDRLRDILSQHFTGAHFFSVLKEDGVTSAADVPRYREKLRNDPNARASLAYRFH